MKLKERSLLTKLLFFGIPATILIVVLFAVMMDELSKQRIEEEVCAYINNDVTTPDTRKCLVADWQALSGSEVLISTPQGEEIWAVFKDGDIRWYLFDRYGHDKKQN